MVHSRWTMSKQTLSLKSLASDLADLRAEVAALKASPAAGGVPDSILDTLKGFDERLQSIEVAKPIELRRLSIDEVYKILDGEPGAQFEVLSDFEAGAGQWRFGAGFRLNACNYPNLRSFLKAGLALGIPDLDREARVEKAKARAAAEREEQMATKAATDASKAAAKAAHDAAEAQERLNAAKAAQDNLED